ncbi:hypothetical protein JQ554_13595 [Bradyrhizobium diazoefficiens]|nr:hypothetical protein [Bradyrhizobium diazoefficiens]MBR0964778.1 hypothetical protein [Bradyrhizobium diazoefficiens]MBR0978951.1 hypothetical protein [Bradyrhizobium diazoefficiens]MBR1006765.1 hypothetical protein [Bradyrhizobium diazoefficiens]MBR1014379.1 hypothetical protein [Bradyrhizobium diazoefficiens]MBR1051946.1 hypothetical protein [Bradyrhizobium diazoefficiens]
MLMAVAAAVLPLAFLHAARGVLQSTLPSHCFTFASTKGMRAKETNSFKIALWSFSIFNFRT